MNAVLDFILIIAAAVNLSVAGFFWLLLALNPRSQEEEAAKLKSLIVLHTVTAIMCKVLTIPMAK